MARVETVRVAFNRGLISPLALARVDLQRSALSAEEQTNFMPRALGSMMLRPGLQYLWNTQGNLAARYIPFVRSLTAMYVLEFVAGSLRIGVNTAGVDALLTRPAVSTVIANDSFDANLTNWTDNDEAGATSDWVIGSLALYGGTGFMRLQGTGTNAAIRDQQILVAGADQNVEHALHIRVIGVAALRVGSTAAGDEYVNEMTLLTGVHSIAFTPTGPNVFIRLLSRSPIQTFIDYCEIEAAGMVSIGTPYAAADLQNIRADSDSLSVDVLFIACQGFTQHRLERRHSGRSWSFVLYQPEDGPFLSPNVGTMTLTPSVLTGIGTLTASRAFFKSTHAAANNTTGNGGALFRLTSTGQTRSVTVTAQNQFSSAIRITGVGTDRAFTINIDNVGVGTTIRLQRSLDSDMGPWTDVATKSWTAATAESFNDELDNQIIWYRIGCKTGEYGAGTSVCTIVTSFGSITGVCRVTSFTSATAVFMEVLSDFGSTDATDEWSEGRWSDLRGWPTAGTLYEGRMNWDGFDQLVLSVSDQFDGFNPDTEGDSGPIDRSIGSGPLETINWALALQRLVLGAQMSIHSVRSNTFDEPLTPTNFNRKQCASQGSANVQAVRIDSRGYFVDGGGTRLMELAFDGETYDYAAEDASKLVPEIGEPTIVRMSVQRKPDTRIHCVRSDGTAAVLLLDKVEKVLCWVEVESIAYSSTGVVQATGLIEDVVVLPGAAGSKEDQVYYVVRRTVGGSTVRFFEKWSKESECVGGTTNKQADSFVAYSGPGVISFPGLGHLIGQEVVVWGNGKDLGRYTVDALGYATGLTETVENGVAGLHYRSRFKSAKLGQTLGKMKNIDHIAAILRNTHAQGLLMGPDFDNMDNLPLMFEGAAVDPDRVYTEYDTESQEFPGTWDVDARICLEANAPRPCTVLAVTVEGQVT